MEEEILGMEQPNAPGGGENGEGNANESKNARNVQGASATGAAAKDKEGTAMGQDALGSEESSAGEGGAGSGSAAGEDVTGSGSAAGEDVARSGGTAGEGTARTAGGAANAEAASNGGIAADTDTDTDADEEADVEDEEEEEDDASEGGVPEEGQKGGKRLKRAKKKKDPKDEKIEELQDMVRRQMAEFDNFRKRTEKEKAQMFEIGAKSIIEKILPVVDNFERGLATIPEEEQGSAFADGMQMVYKQLMNELTQLGVTPIEAVGQEFNPEYHNAVMQVEDEELESGTVAQELQKGYLYRDTVVRHSMVAVVQ